MSVYTKMFDAFSQIEAVEKKGENKNKGYTYQAHADVSKAVRDILIKVRLLPLVSVNFHGEHLETLSRKNEKMHGRAVLATVTFVDPDTGEMSVPIHAPGEALDDGDKSVYKANTSAVREALKKLFLLPEGNDVEADASVDKAMSAGKSGIKPPQRKSESKKKSAPPIDYDPSMFDDPVPAASKPEAPKPSKATSFDPSTFVDEEIP